MKNNVLQNKNTNKQKKVKNKKSVREFILYTTKPKGEWFVSRKDFQLKLSLHFFD